MQMYHVFDLDVGAGYKMATTSIVLTRGSFYSPSKALEIFPGACPVTDRRFNVCFIGTNMPFGFEKKKRKEKKNKKTTTTKKKPCLFHRAMGPLRLIY